MRGTEILRVAIGVLILLSSTRALLAEIVLSNPARTVVAQVNGDTITLAEVDAAIAQRPQLTVPSAAQRRQMRVDVITAMIDDLLLRQFMREHGAQIDPMYINKQFAALEESLKAQNKTVESYLRELNQTEAQVRATMTLLLQLDCYVRTNTSEVDMRKYYNSYKDYFDGVTVRTSHIVFRLPPNASPADRDQVRQQLQALRSDILAGKIDFAQAALQKSQCPSAPKGGDIGFIYRKFQNVDEAYARTAFAMKAGEISDVVDTEFGLQLIKVTERTPGKPTKYEEMAEQVRDCYAEDLRMALLDSLRKKAKVTVTLP